MGVVTSALSARPNEERDEVKRWAERYSFCVFLAFFCLVSDSLLSTWKKPLEWTGWLPINIWDVLACGGRLHGVLLEILKRLNVIFQETNSRSLLLRLFGAPGKI